LSRFKINANHIFNQRTQRDICTYVEARLDVDLALFNLNKLHIKNFATTKPAAPVVKKKQQQTQMQSQFDQLLELIK
jgi:hypothetical protein